MTRIIPLLTVAALMAAGQLPGRAHAQTAAPAQPAASAPAPEGLRVETSKPVLAAQDLIRSANYKEALERLREAEAIPNRTPYETYIIDRLRGSAAAGAGDDTLAARSYESALATGRLQGAEQLSVLEALAGAYYRAKDYARTLDVVARHAAAGGSRAQLEAIQTNSFYLSGDYGQAAKALQQRIRSADAAGKPIDEVSLRMLASSQAKLADEAGYGATLERLVAAYPKPEYWADVIARVQARNGFSERLLLDVFRLRQAVGVLIDPVQYVALAELAMRANLPLEARAVLDAGYKSGRLGVGAAAAQHQALRDRVQKQAIEDERALAVDSGVRNAEGLVATGEALVSAGRVPRGIELLEQGVARGGLRRPEEARLRLGQAYLQVGDKARAVAAFKAVESAPEGIGDIARLWALFAAQP